ncbi:MAG: haloacid dehalogenase-like hydrolase, partial [Lachnospiraceae bacterium]|nr:haloacid dehalogenase-like hydrolase [Lachnospiraceae bacterium]
MKKTKPWLQLLFSALVMSILVFGVSGMAFADTPKEASLSYWSEGSAAAASIEEYVKSATDEASDKYIPVEDRIAVFDLDGTIIGELYPSYFEYMMFIHRALYDDTFTAPSDMKEFALALEEGIKTGNMPEGNKTLHAKYAGQAYAGMTIEEMKDYTKAFMMSKADGFENLTRGDAFYAPMVSLVKYLDANDFTCYIVSGSDRTLVRAVIEDTLPIPENRVIGMSYTMVATGQNGEDGLEYVYSKDDEVILGGDLIIKTIKMNKVSEIALEIGKVPVLAFGNSSGDISMAQYTVNNPDYEGKAYLVLCDDLEREHGSPEKADSMKKTCEEKGFETISMRDDFATIYGDEVKVTDYAYNEADALKGVTKTTGEFTEQEYPVFKEKMTDQKIAIRYYEDYPNIPYVGIKEYYDCVVKESKDPGPEIMTVTKEKNGIYHLKSAHGEAVADVVHDTLESEDMGEFTNIMCLVQEGMPNGYNDGLPYTRVKDVTYSGSGKAAFDFAKYEIEVYGDDKDVYFPLSTLSDIFSDLIYHYSVFNGETFYLNGDPNTEDMADIDPHYAEPILAKLDKDLNLPEDLADYTYHELLFSFDYFYGCPGKAVLNDEIREYGLEKALKGYGEVGEFTLKMLKSRNYPEHLFGVGRLQYFVGDGGHTVVNMLNFGEADISKLWDKIDELKEEYLPLYEEAIAEAAPHEDLIDNYYFARQKFREDRYGDKKYIKEGDTAVYILDDFMSFGEEEWKAYYAG